MYILPKLTMYMFASVSEFAINMPVLVTSDAVATCSGENGAYMQDVRQGVDCTCCPAPAEPAVEETPHPCWMHPALVLQHATAALVAKIGGGQEQQHQAQGRPTLAWVNTRSKHRQASC